MNTPYFDSLFDDFGIWQHADGIKPIASEGYALDDATRGLVLCLTLNRMDQADVLFDYILKSKIDNILYGFSTDEHKFINAPASEDAMGQIIWAFGYAISINYRKEEAEEFINSLVPSLLSMRSLRGPVYALLGAVYIDDILASIIAENIMKRFEGLSDDWLWPEETITYGNGIVPYALLRYALVSDDKKAETLGRKALEFLEKCCTIDRIRGPIGNEDWFSKGESKPADFKQQPIDTAYMVWAWMAAYQISKNPDDLEYANLWMKWFEGDNIAGGKMYDPATLKAYNGIDRPGHPESDEKGVNYHSGAETNICFLLSLWMTKEQKTI
ncbi:MAG: hypothetical protein WA087_00225 [Candidatus Saccharimonadales bacterium]